MIRIANLTKQFKNGKGIFDINLEVKRGEVLGFIGPNGAGKSTTIRHLLGFLKPDKGKAYINDVDCWLESEKVKGRVGYLPGEIVFPAGMTAIEFLAFQDSIHNKKGQTYAKELIERFQLNIHIPIKNMSKGMKQKVAIVSTFMCDPDIIILDEPSTGLDPLMQKELITVLREEKKKGKTIFLSSHIFEEIETISDTICIIKDGKLVNNQSMEEACNQMQQTVLVRFTHQNIVLEVPHIKNSDGSISFPITNNENEVIREIAKYDIHSMHMNTMKLSQVFEKYYMKGEQ